MIVALAGGTGAAKLLRGLVHVTEPSRLFIVGNTGDDLDWWGLRVSPDLDSVAYALAGLLDATRGWGVRDDTFHCLEAMGRLGRETWFRLGRPRPGDPPAPDPAPPRRRLAQRRHPRDRRRARRDGAARADVRRPGADRAPHRRTAGSAWRSSSSVSGARPMSSTSRTGAPRARGPRPSVLDAIDAAEAVVVCCSNPVTSIGPILAVPGIVDALVRTPAPVVAVSPIVGGQAVSGPAAKLLAGPGPRRLPAGRGAGVPALAGRPGHRPRGRGARVRPRAGRRAAGRRRRAHARCGGRGPPRPRRPRGRRSSPREGRRRPGQGVHGREAAPRRRAAGRGARGARPRHAGGRPGRPRARRRSTGSWSSRPTPRSPRSPSGGARWSSGRPKAMATPPRSRGASRSAGSGARRVLLTVPGDLPCLTADEVRRILEACGPAPAAVFVPSRSGLGTNAACLAPPDAVPLRFGEPSFADHLAAARARGIEPVVLPLPGAGLDIDRPGGSPGPPPGGTGDARGPRAADAPPDAPAAPRPETRGVRDPRACPSSGPATISRASRWRRPRPRARRSRPATSSCSARRPSPRSRAAWYGSPT